MLVVEVKPNAKETKILGWKDAGTVVISLHAPARDGEANRELIRFLAEHFHIAKSLIEIKQGHGAKVKLVSLPNALQKGL